MYVLLYNIYQNDPRGRRRNETESTKHKLARYGHGDQINDGKFLKQCQPLKATSKSRTRDKSFKVTKEDNTVHAGHLFGLHVLCWCGFRHFSFKKRANVRK